MKPIHEDELRAENALMKLRLELDHGMQASHFAGQLSPAMENAWLNMIVDFEKKFSSTKPVSMYEHLGKPQVKVWDALTPAQIGSENRRLLDLLRKKHVVFESLNPIDDLECYRFITEELFVEQIVFVPGAGMAVHIVYEEFKERN